MGAVPESSWRGLRCASGGPESVPRRRRTADDRGVAQTYGADADERVPSARPVIRSGPTRARHRAPDVDDRDVWMDTLPIAADWSDEYGRHAARVTSVPELRIHPAGITSQGRAAAAICPKSGPGPAPAGGGGAGQWRPGWLHRLRAARRTTTHQPREHNGVTMTAATGLGGHGSTTGAAPVDVALSQHSGPAVGCDLSAAEGPLPAAAASLPVEVIPEALTAPITAPTPAAQSDQGPSSCARAMPASHD